MRVTPPAGTPKPASNGRSGGPPRRVLLVEDNADAREMVCVLLSLAGYEVHEAGDGPTGLAVVERAPIDVALIDVGLPGLDGYEVARRIRRGERGKSMRLVAMTGYGQTEDVQRARDAGFDAHLTKPVSPEALTAAIEGDNAQYR